MAEQQTTWETTDEYLGRLAKDGGTVAEAIAFNTLIQARRLADATERSALAQERQAVALETLARAVELGVVDGGRECSALRIRDLS